MTGLAIKFGLGTVLGRAREIVGAVPRWLWLILAGAALLALANCAHQSAVKSAYRTGYDAGVIDTNRLWKESFAKLQAATRTWKDTHARQSAALAGKRREAQNANLRAIAASADLLRLRGPGRISYPRIGPASEPGLSGSSGGHDAAGGGADDAVAGMPADTAYAILPWGALVDRGEQCDANRDEVIAWRAHDAEQRRLHNEALANAPQSNATE